MNVAILSLSDSRATVETVGGKGVSLAKLAVAGLPVPDGFHVTTAAYRQFVDANGLQVRIGEALRGVDRSRPSTLETASASIGRAFAEAEIPDDLLTAIVHAYGVLPGPTPSVAVRSSATAEDLPEASFAGQQDTYLNVIGPDRVLEATRKCWASLWTARAIGYRAEHGIPAEGLALAVVVQLLVDAEAAGIMFTANPLTGSRDEIVINAAWGLGESVVGGKVTPDTLIVSKPDGTTVASETADKRVMTVRAEAGTVEQAVPDALRKVAVLSSEQAAALARYGVQIEALYGVPMDIEWALSDGVFAIVQARPITALGSAAPGEEPLEWKPPTSKGIYMRTSVVDLMPDPLSPLFVTLGIPALVAQMYPLGKVMTRVEPVLPEGYFTTINTYAYMNAHFTARSWWWILFGLLPSYPRLLRLAVPVWRDEARPKYRRAVAEMQDRDIEQLPGTELWQGIQGIVDAAAYYTSTLMFATMGASSGSEGLLTMIYGKMAYREGDPPAAALLMGWDSIPIRAEKSLFDLAEFCRAHESLGPYVLATPSGVLVEVLDSDQGPPVVAHSDWQEFRRRFARHLQEFGYMVFDLDFAKPLPSDHPAPMLEVIRMYLRGEGTNPYERQRASERQRVETAEGALGRVKGVRRWVFRKALAWAQSLSEVREDALAEIGLGYPLIRRMLHVLGERCVRTGALEQATDIFWLEKEEVESAVQSLDSGMTLNSMATRVQQRKDFWERAKRATPPPILPPRKKVMGIDTAVFLAESEANQAVGTLKGVAASPGRVTAPACVLYGPEDFDRMRPGDVLVAGTTTPAWTPLFAMAAAVVTDIGGPLSHGSIVAREYGIPAVMGTGVATRRIRDGQMLTVDGAAGTVLLLER